MRGGGVCMENPAFAEHRLDLPQTQKLVLPKLEATVAELTNLVRHHPSLPQTAREKFSPPRHPKIGGRELHSEHHRVRTVVTVMRHHTLVNK